jgi:hypothetical protein
VRGWPTTAAVDDPLGRRVPFELLVERRRTLGEQRRGRLANLDREASRIHATSGDRQGPLLSVSGGR